MLFGSSDADDPRLAPADGPTLRPRFHRDDPEPAGGDTDAPEDATTVGGDRRSARRSLRLRLGAVGLAVAVILAALGVAADLMRPKPQLDRPDLRVMAWWWDAFDTFPREIGSGPWRKSVCDGDDGHVQDVITREVQRQESGWPSREWVVDIGFQDLTYRQTGQTATASLSSTTEFYPRGENGFNQWSGLDQDWRFTLNRDGDRWCVHRVSVSYRPGFDPAEQTPTYGGGSLIGGGGLVGNAPGEAGDESIGGGVNGEAQR
jgi:hypothetical protein